MTILLRLTYLNRTKQYITHTEEETFSTKKEAKQHLKDMFPHKRTNMYRDTDNGNSKHIGYVYSRYNKYEDTQKRFIEEIWVTFYQVKEVNPND